MTTSPSLVEIFPRAPMGMSVILFIAVLILLAILWNFHRDKNNKLDIKDLICHDGKLNEAKFCRFGAYVVSTWGFVYLVLVDKLGEWYFAGYMAAWAGNALIGKYLEIKKLKLDPPPSVPPNKPVI